VRVWLLVPSLPFRRPVLQRPILEIKIQRLAVGTSGDDTGVVEWLVEEVGFGFLLLESGK